MKVIYLCILSLGTKLLNDFGIPNGPIHACFWLHHETYWPMSPYLGNANEKTQTIILQSHKHKLIHSHSYETCGPHILKGCVWLACLARIICVNVCVSL